MEHGIVARNSDSMFPYQGWPTVARDADGTLYVGASSHRMAHICPFGENYLYVSHDEGKSWSVPLVVNNTQMDNRDGGVCAWGSGELIFTWFDLEAKRLYDLADNVKKPESPAASRLFVGMLDKWRDLPDEMTHHASYLRVSHDGGFTWSDRVTVPVSSPHGPTRMADGSLLYIGKDCSGGLLDEDGAVYALVSRDGGMTWDVLSKLPCPAGLVWDQIWEPHGLELPDGTILAALRSHPDDIKLTTHICRSTDGGRTWSEPVRPKDLLGSPPHLMVHSSGAVILTYGNRSTAIHPLGQYARISYDGGLTWSEDICINAETPDGDHGYPSTVELSDGSLFTVYYQKYGNDSYDSILWTRWELPKR